MRENWTWNETILAFDLYCRLPSKDVVVGNPAIAELAAALGRTAGSVKMKLQNFKGYDPSYTFDGRVGLSHGSKIDAEVVQEFIDNWDGLVLQAQKIRDEVGLSDVEKEADELSLLHIPLEFSKERIQKVRVGQSFFRKAVLAAYDKRCCITGIDMPELLVASHIKPWSASNDIDEKVNPQNGLLLNGLHDLAFDKGLITISEDYKIILSPKLNNNANKLSTEFFFKYKNQPIALPSRFLPAKQFIKYHNDIVFQK
ncbi:MAG: HNH endonuclease [Clostridiales bacterium]|jgi:putative restriction endonuclease|nr:HNH endonuclease [Clostridiales bacterium]